jgi:two-component system, NtrC family, sensor kinase
MKNASILIVDDDPLSIRVLRHHLGKLYSVAVATNGEQALQLADGSSPPDLVLLDVLMPGMNGFEVCARLKANPRTAGIPVIFITGLSDTASEQKGLELGAVDFISKPSSAPRLRARVHNHLELKRHRDDLESLVLERTGELLIKQHQLVELHGKLEQQNLNLEKHRDNLEILVNERTAELMNKQHQLSELNENLEQMVIEEVNKNREKDMLMIHQERLASIGKLAAGVAHEVNNPLGFIMCNLGTLKNYTEVMRQYMSAQDDALKICCPEEQLEQLSELHTRFDLPFILEEDLATLISETLDGAERVKRIVLDLKDFARADDSNMQTTDLNHCVQSTVIIVRNEINPVADLDLKLGFLPPLICNPQHINQVIANLLLNAAHAMKIRGQITVTTLCESNKIFLSVTDTGEGIPPEVIGKIFDPFFTTKQVGKGIGLGLSISYDIIKKHGGEITVSSEAGVGTTFVVSLPIRRSTDPRRGQSDDNEQVVNSDFKTG